MENPTNTPSNVLKKSTLYTARPLESARPLPWHYKVLWLVVVVGGGVLTYHTLANLSQLAGVLLAPAEIKSQLEARYFGGNAPQLPDFRAWYNTALTHLQTIDWAQEYQELETTTQDILAGPRPLTPPLTPEEQLKQLVVGATTPSITHPPVTHTGADMAAENAEITPEFPAGIPLGFPPVSVP